MDVTSTYKNARISARKARDVAREIQGLPLSSALELLAFTPRKGAQLFEKTLKAAAADAENNFSLDAEGLHIKSAVVGEGATLRRFKARARGSAGAIRKRTSHIVVVLSDEQPEARGSKSKGAPAPAKESKPGKSAAKGASPAESSAEAVVDERRGLVYQSRPANSDNLQEISGVGSAIEEKLHSVGIYTFEQIASWTEENIAEFDELLALKGRVDREEWVVKARALHEEKYGK